MGGGVKGKEQREVGGRGEAKTRGVWEIVGGGGVCMSIWFPLCMCMFVFVGEERESWERGGGGKQRASAGL